ncbi:hypothetical protein J421_1694 [Gemmatirosa kalamazoonensis]|uniref:Uncharacterized protein n=1 Tax=Gemmatirosa kalamazoonensis TaxID=861299 RepID=W0REM5_9BACT|nr:hypothetical protein [Gemmatirosa kalamazoonensis]AHG89231.1 hypothetical protein J421_1694 [Gemmatirosa kalamazoonensis]
MSGSSGNTNSKKGGRAPRHGNDDVSARHNQGGPQQVQGGSPEESARGSVTGRNDSRLADPDRPTDQD